MEDFPWVYAAMIFIAFLSWVHSRIQEAAAKRRIRAAAKKAEQDARRISRDLPTSSPFRRLGETAAPGPAVPATPIATSEVTGGFRDFFEILEKIAKPEGEKFTPAPIPPPLPISAPIPALSRAAPEKHPASTKIVRAKRVSPAELLKKRDTLRKAMILKEILDAPLALRD